MSNNNRGRQFMSSVKARLGDVDDFTQQQMRRLYGQGDDGRYSNPIGGAIGEFFHSDRSSYANNPNGNYALAASRGLQAAALGGGVTAAGYGLHQLTQAMAQYGSPADYPEQNQLSL